MTQPNFYAADGGLQFVQITALTPDPTRRYRVFTSDDAHFSAVSLRAMAAWLTAFANEVAPSGYTIAFNATYTKGTDDTAARVNITGAQVGAAYRITVSSSGGGTPVVKTGTVAEAAFNVTPIDLSGLTAGALTATIVLTDTDHEAGPSVTGIGTLSAA